MSSAFENTIFEDPILNVIHLLNSIAQENPEAISLASGRPDDEQCDPVLIDKGLSRYQQHVASTEQSLATLLCQYGKTAGVINDILADYLQVDEGIKVLNPESIVVCMGFQEACTLTLLSIFEGGGILLVPDPVFSGITGIAKLLRIKILPVPMATFLNPTALRKVAEDLESRGEKIKALYAIADFSNPTADSLSYHDRRAMLRLAKEMDFFILEDTAYSYFRYEGEKIPSMKSIDSSRVFLLGSFSKSIFPGLRMGYVVAPEGDGVMPFSTRLCKAKSLVTVNTPALCQAVVAGLLIENHYSLKGLNQPRVLSYTNKRDHMIKCLERQFPLKADARRTITWNHPAGGFFINVHLPFVFGYSEMCECAKDFKVIVFPTSLFSLTNDAVTQVRLSFSNATTPEVTQAIDRFRAYVEFKMP
ncbi:MULTISPECIES: aminotransferase-like domain-containing protein [Pseudomonas]|uniref:PLP-dependent aminotransferase family protein n=1 Tax=Pseudomonas viciae TaxID=2505979 RepID=A0ABY8P9V3_9PSED|nr:PLP-dependent aminotransferase family protein [Pseudomonas viciae]WGO91963.1 PLP-dependent aminotransferase family protein [Pseudomonas viciae]